MTALQIITVGSFVLWFAFQEVLRRWTSTPAVEPVRITAEPGSETPAIVTMAVNNWQLTDDAVPATVIDLAARGVLKFSPDSMTIEVPEVVPTDLRSYEETLVRYLRERAKDGVVRAEALEDRPTDFYWKFANEVEAEADTHGRVRKRWSGRQRAALIFASLVPSVLAVTLIPWTTPADIYLGRWYLIAILWFVLSLFALRGPAARPTPPAIELAASWLGYRKFLQESPDIATALPADVTIWGRQLAYAAACGLAEVTLWLLPLGVNDRTTAWTNHTGRWKKIKIWYPWMLGWGRRPRRRATHALWKLTVGGVILWLAEPELFGVRKIAANAMWWTTGKPLATALVVLAAGLLDIALLITEALTRRPHTGVVLRTSRSKQADVYVAVRTGEEERTKAFIVPWIKANGIERGTEVQLTAGSGIGWVTEVKVLGFAVG